MATVETDYGEIELPENEAKYLKYKGYRGDSLLKKAGVQIEWTPETITEYGKCEQDPKYFIENYMKIVHVDHGLIPFKLRNYQVDLVNNFHNYRRNIVTMARQSGKSTAVIGYILWFILFNKHKTVMILANKAPTAREILGKAQLAYLHLPKFLQQGVMEWNKGSIVLENGSRAIAEATSSDSVRGYTANILVLDEAAHIEHWEDFSKSTMPTISSGSTTKLMLISTPKGLNHFYQTWVLAQQHSKTPQQQKDENLRWNGYMPLMVTWREVPGRDEEWYQSTLSEMNFDLDKFAQEYECQFLGSSGTLIAGWKLKEMVPTVAIYQKDGLKKYEDPEKDHSYMMTADVSEGKGLDYSAFHVTDITAMPYKQVCVFRSNLITPHEYAQIIFATATSYNNASVLIEYDNLGPQVADALHEMSFEGLLHTESAGNRGKRISTMTGKMIDNGIKMTPGVKGTGCSLIKLLIEQNKYIVNDYDTIAEFSRFSRQGKGYEAEEGANDDLVMGLVVFGWLSNQQYFKEMTNIDTLANLRDKTEEQVEETLTGFGFVDRGPDDVIAAAEAFHNPMFNFDTILRKAFEDSDKYHNF